MSEHNQFDNQGPMAASRRSYSADDLGYPEKGGGLFRHPLIAFLILLITAGIFGGIMLLTFSGGDKGDVLPVVRADSSPVKSVPNDKGGMDIPNSDSTVFTQLRSDDDATRDADGGVENLFASSAVNKTVQGGEGTNPPAEGLSAADEEAVKQAEAIVKSIQEKAVAAEEVADKIAADANNSAKAVVSSTERPKELHAAGSSPETLAFVKRALEEKEAAVVEVPEPVKVTPKIVAKADPATSAAGTHFVQMASVQDQARAGEEWGKLQAKYSALSGAAYRVQRKDLGEKGVFFRIQAGPFSKTAAASKCDAVKQAGGGCFVVAR